MKFLDGFTKKWITLIAMVLLSITTLGAKLDFMNNEYFGFSVIKIIAVVTIISAWWVYNREITLV